MARVSLKEVRSIGDVLTVADWRFEVPILPGRGLNTRLGIKCQTVTWPGMENLAPIKELFGHKLPHRGPQSLGNRLEVTYLEDTKLDTYLTLRAWHSQVVDPFSGDSVQKDLYSTVGLLYLFSPKGVALSQFNIWGLFPLHISDVTLDGTQSAAMVRHCTFSFDYLF